MNQTDNKTKVTNFAELIQANRSIILGIIVIILLFIGLLTTLLIVKGGKITFPWITLALNSDTLVQRAKEDALRIKGSVRICDSVRIRDSVRMVDSCRVRNVERKTISRPTDLLIRPIAGDWDFVHSAGIANLKIGRTSEGKYYMNLNNGINHEGSGWFYSIDTSVVFFMIRTAGGNKSAYAWRIKLKNQNTIEIFQQLLTGTSEENRSSEGKYICNRHGTGN